MLCCAARLSAVVLCCAGLCYAALPLVRFMRSGRLLCRLFCRVSLCCLWRLLWHFPATERSREKANSGAEGARKTMSKGSEHVRNMSPETRANEPPEPKNDSKIAPNLLQHHSNMAPWRPLGGLWGARGLRRCFPELSWGALGGSWGHLESLLAALGAVLGPPGGPRRVPEGPREAPGGALGGHFGSHFGSRALRHEKVRKNNPDEQKNEGKC